MSLICFEQYDEPTGNLNLGLLRVPVKGLLKIERTYSRTYADEYGWLTQLEPTQSKPATTNCEFYVCTGAFCKGKLIINSPTTETLQVLKLFFDNDSEVIFNGSVEINADKRVQS